MLLITSLGYNTLDIKECTNWFLKTCFELIVGNDTVLVEIRCFEPHVNLQRIKYQILILMQPRKSILTLNLSSIFHSDWKILEYWNFAKIQKSHLIYGESFPDQLSCLLCLLKILLYIRIIYCRGIVWFESYRRCNVPSPLGVYEVEQLVDLLLVNVMAFCLATHRFPSSNWDLIEENLNIFFTFL